MTNLRCEMALCAALAVAGCARSTAPVAAQTQAIESTTGTATWFNVVKMNYVRMGAENLPDGGTPTKKRVVLLHHGDMDSSEWAEAQALLAANYDVVAVDLFGHGKSTCIDKQVSISMQGELIDAVLDSLGWDKAHWVGVDEGGHIAAYHAMIGSPRVQSLSLLASTGLSTSVIGFYQGLPPVVPVGEPDPSNHMVAFGLTCVFGCQSFPPLWPPGSTAAAKQAFNLFLNKRKSMVTDQFAQDVFKAELARSCFSANTRMAANGTSAFVDAMTAQDLGKIAVPTLVLWGDADQVLKAGPWTAAWTKIPGSTSQTLAGCGHDLARDCPDEVAAALKTFIDSH